MAKYQAYPEYKDSNNKWLAELPTHWKLVALKHVLVMPMTDGPHETPEFIDEGVPFVSAEAVSSGQIDFNKIRGFISEADDIRFSKKYKPQLHDVYMIKSGATTGITAIVETDQHFNIWSPLAAMRCKQIYEPYFLLNYLRSDPFQKSVQLSWTFGTQQNIGMATLQNLPVCLPPKEEQKKIAEFLNYETSKIDHLIEKQQQLIELLKEKRQAVISHAVTKGLNPNVPMKDSGVAWLGEVPEHWDVSKFAYLKQVLTDYTANGSFADLKANVQYLDEPSFARLVRLTDLRKDLANTDGVWVNKKSYEYLKKSALYGGEFLLANVGAYAGLFYQMPFDKGYASLAPNMFMAKFDQSKVSREFMAYVGQSIPVSSQLRLSATASSAQPKLNKDDFKAVSFVYPGLKEQQKIVDYLDQELKQIDILLKKQEQAISLMQERRTALISAAVTGKIDVRNWQAPTLAEADTELNA
ncbi:restriction endonuclease subunit S [Acinetobacter indicus]|nr:restriction endonuclease subunit S [Acinetobacter indicus]QLB59925.1 restriction endonuclease subunit S [Acinetobacter indicus]